MGRSYSFGYNEVVVNNLWTIHGSRTQIVTLMSRQIPGVTEYPEVQLH